VIPAASLVVAARAGPVSYEVQHYHLSRVLHWIQNRSVIPYATGVEIQNSQAPFSEFVLLQLHLLTSSDALANLVQWSAMLLSLVAVSLLAKTLGGDRRVQLLAAIFAVTLPVGISQSSTAEADFVVTFFILESVLELMRCLRKSEPHVAGLFAGMAGGLAVLTKLTAPAYVLPFAIATALALLLKRERRSVTLALAAGCLLGLMIDLPHYTRVLSLYHAFSEPSMIREHVNEQWDIPAAASNILRHAAIHAGTPWPYVNDWISRGIIKAHILLHQHLNDPRTTLTPFKVREPHVDEMDGNPLHASIIIVAFGVLLISARRRRSGVLVYAAMTVLAFLLFAVTNKWQVYGNRYHLPFFLLAAAPAAVALTPRRWTVMTLLIASLLVGYATPWAVRLHERPLLPILQSPWQERVLATMGSKRDSALAIAKAIQARECLEVGIMISGAYPAAEYPYWILLGAPESGVRLEWIVAGNASSEIEPPNFHPCAVICDETCPRAWSDVRGLPLLTEDKGLRLFAR
jgi:4-amino-4-deoxy-L-arabinose transferase-like glycosyltransferase